LESETSKREKVTVMGVAMQDLHLSFLFLPVDLYLVGESSWQVLRISGN